MERRDSIEHIVKAFFEKIDDCKITPFGSGLIHRTFFLGHPSGDFILQNINTSIFKNPEELMNNIYLVGEHLQKKAYPKAILSIRKTLTGKLLFESSKNQYWRIFEFIADTKEFNTPQSIEQVYQTGKSFGEFLTYLNDLPNHQIKPSIADFHNTQLRLEKLNQAISVDSFDRVKLVQKELEMINTNINLIEKFEQLNCPIRVVHADPKINNLLFDQNNQVKAVIDWDTIMPGYILHDFGDLVRTVSCTENEESINFEKVKVSIPYLNSLTKGFLESTASWLKSVERENLMLGAKVIILEQAIRFLTDFLKGDHYYSTSYPEQNLNRVKNQILLLSSIEELN